MHKCHYKIIFGISIKNTFNTRLSFNVAHEVKRLSNFSFEIQLQHKFQNGNDILKTIFRLIIFS